MVKAKNKYPWTDELNKAPLIEDHSRIKHSIIKDYIASYLKVVASPPARAIKLFIIDGFCGGGLYKTISNEPHFGSPIIALDTIKKTVGEIVGDRIVSNIRHEFKVDCEFYFIDKDQAAIDVLKKVSAPHIIIDEKLPLSMRVNFICGEFSQIYKDILKKVGKSKALFILDPCGYSETPLQVMKEIMHEPHKKREVIWTFMIDNLKAYANEDSQALKNAGYHNLLSLFNKGQKPSSFCIQKEIFNLIRQDLQIPFSTPFAIKQKVGWNYWLIHLAWHYRASEVMKDVEHLHADEREHYGQSGLNMMAAQGDRPYLFGRDDIERGRKRLEEDLPQFLFKPAHLEGISFNDFMESTYNETPLKSEVIKGVLINHEDIEILTPNGNKRSSIKRIGTSDIVRAKRQTRLIF